VIVEIEDNDGRTFPIRGMLDTGCSRLIMLKKFTDRERLQKLSSKDRITYDTYGGKFHASRTASVGFRLVEFNTNKKVEFDVVVDDTTNPSEARYDMIIGTNIMDVMGIDIMFSEKVIYWDGDSCPMKVYGSFQDRAEVDACYIAATEDPILKQAEERQKSILDCDYSKVDIKEMVRQLKISPASKKKLYPTLKKFPTLFGGSLGKVDCEPIHIDLKPGTKPSKQRYYNVPKA